MKAQYNASIEVSTIDAVRQRAGQAGVALGDLTDLFLRFALERLSVDAVKKWAHETERAGPARGLGPVMKGERLVLMAFDVLKAKQDGAWRFSLGDIAAEAGLKLSEAFWALKTLQRRGEVHGMELEELDRWGRPVKSFWSLISAMPEAMRPKPG